MKTSPILRDFKTLFFALALTFASVSGYSQWDTLHLYYKGLQTALLDSNEVKIGAWAKKLNGKHVVVDIVSYYEKSDFKKYSETRAAEALLIVNRKARDLVQINFSGAKKGEKSQRSTVDIIYIEVGSNTKPVADKKENATKTKDEAKEKVAVESKEKKEKVKEKKEEVKGKVKEKEKEVEEKKETVNKNTKEKSDADPRIKYDTSYVNGEMVLTKKYDPNFTYDTIYVNGEMHISKRKLKKKK
ncbi:MAG: hypothetical protein IT236_16670 [Bacteroidia bacterium]|nr:hypothetical protein [Bacteroidia bacterium]